MTIEGRPEQVIRRPEPFVGVTTGIVTSFPLPSQEGLVPVEAHMQVMPGNTAAAWGEHLINQKSPLHAVATAKNVIVWAPDRGVTHKDLYKSWSGKDGDHRDFVTVFAQFDEKERPHIAIMNFNPDLKGVVAKTLGYLRRSLGKEAKNVGVTYTHEYEVNKKHN